MATLLEQIANIQSLYEDLEALAFGDENTSATHNGQTRDSLAKAIKGKFDALQAMVQGRLTYETKAAMDAAGAPPAGELAEVWNDSTIENNGLYGWSGSAWVASDYDSINRTLNKIRALRAENQYFDPVFSEGVPDVRTGIPAITTIADAYLNGLGATDGLYVSVGDGSVTAPFVKVPIDPRDIGRNVVMSFYAYFGDGAPVSTPGTLRSAFIESDGVTLVYDGLTYSIEEVSTDVHLCISHGVIPANAAYLAIGGNIYADDGSRSITGVTYAVSAAEITKDTFSYDDLRRLKDIATEEFVDKKATENARAEFSARARGEIKNVLSSGDFISGEPSIRSGSAVVTSPIGYLTETAGLLKSIQWRSGNEFIRYSAGQSITDKYFFGAFIVHSDNPSNLLSGASAFEESSGGTLYTPPGYTSGYVELDSKTRLVWCKGQVANAAAVNFLVGGISSPADDTRYASGFFAYLADADFDKDDAIDVYFNDQSYRSAAQKSALAVRSEVVKIDQSKRPHFFLSSDPTVESYVVGYIGQDEITRVCEPFPVIGAQADNDFPVFNWTEDKVNGVRVKQGKDEAAPYRVMNTTIGANHGYTIGVCTASSHGKTATDVGSVYQHSDGNEYVIVEVPDTDTVILTKRLTNADIPTGTFTHVSGGADTGTITVTSQSKDQWRPSHVNRSIKCYADGVEILDRDIEIPYSNSVKFVESYDIQTKTGMVEYCIANGVSIPESDDIAVSVNIVNEVDINGQVVVYTDFFAHQDMSMSDVMFVQAMRGELTDYYIPKALPFTHDGVAFDYANIEPADKTITEGTSSIYMTPDRCEPSGILCDRVVAFNGSASMFAIGYLPVADSDPVRRRTNCTDMALEIRNNTGKIYPRCIDVGDTTVTAGTYYSAAAYRSVTPKSSERTSGYVIRSRFGVFVYCDWHDVIKTDRFPIPDDLAGMEITEIEVSDGVTVVSEFASAAIVFDVSVSGSYGYAILRLA